MAASTGHFDWERIADDGAGYILTERMRVPGGWLYRVLILPPTSEESSTVALTFVPDKGRDFPLSNAGVEHH